MKQLVAFIAALALLASPVVRAELPPLVPRELLFGSPTNSKSSPSLSPNGKYLAYIALAPDNPVYNVWVRSIGRQDDRVITQEKKRPVGWYYWQPDSDAAVSVGFNEVRLWFESRGDRCTNCPSALEMAGWTAAPDQMTIRIRKRP